MNSLKRAVGVIIKDRKILVIHRINHGKEYYVLPGGRLETGETEHEAVIRELGEETSFKNITCHYIFDLEHHERRHYFFLVDSFTGEPILGGEEKGFMTEQNQYLLEWKTAQEFSELKNFYPEEAKDKLLNYLISSRPS
jgi:8-oxo-dGTP diphosphatase